MTLWCKNQENPSDGISHAWAPLKPKSDKTAKKHILKMYPRIPFYISGLGGFILSEKSQNRFTLM
jgi:hypothetical protein